MSNDELTARLARAQAVTQLDPPSPITRRPTVSKDERVKSAADALTACIKQIEGLDDEQREAVFRGLTAYFDRPPPRPKHSGQPFGGASR